MITATPNQEANTNYYADDDYDTVLVSGFFAVVQASLTNVSYEGGNADRQEASAIMGRNSILVRLMRSEWTFKSYNCMHIAGESEQERLGQPANDQSVDIRFAIGTSYYPDSSSPTVVDGETKTTATLRWVTECLTAMEVVVQTLRLPFTTPSLAAGLAGVAAFAESALSTLAANQQPSPLLNDEGSPVFGVFGGTNAVLTSTPTANPGDYFVP